MNTENNGLLTISTDGTGNIDTDYSNYVSSGYLLYNSDKIKNSFAERVGKTFIIAKKLVESKRVQVKTLHDFFALADEIDSCFDSPQ